MPAQPHPDPKHRVKITIAATEAERLQIRMLAAKSNMTITDYIMSYVRPNIPQDTPNLETLEAIRDVEERRNLTSSNSIEQFWNAMGIDRSAQHQRHKRVQKKSKKI